MDKRSHINRITQQFELSEPLPHIELSGRNFATVEGCNGIVEYDGCIVKINCGNSLVKFIGCDLSIKTLSVDRICVTGKIAGIEFE